MGIFSLSNTVNLSTKISKAWSGSLQLKTPDQSAKSKLDFRLKILSWVKRRVWTYALGTEVRRRGKLAKIGKWSDMSDKIIAHFGSG